MKKRIIIFIDDYRTPNKYVNVNTNRVYQAYSYNDFVALLNKLYKKYRIIDEVWFDHDLGPVEQGNGLDCAKYLVQFCEDNHMELPEYHIQSANTVGRLNIDSYLKSYLKSLII